MHRRPSLGLWISSAKNISPFLCCSFHHLHHSRFPLLFRQFQGQPPKHSPTSFSSIAKGAVFIHWLTIYLRVDEFKRAVHIALFARHTPLTLRQRHMSISTSTEYATVRLTERQFTDNQSPLLPDLFRHAHRPRGSVGAYNRLAGRSRGGPPGAYKTPIGGSNGVGYYDRPWRRIFIGGCRHGNGDRATHVLFATQRTNLN